MDILEDFERKCTANRDSLLPFRARPHNPRSGFHPQYGLLYDNDFSANLLFQMLTLVGKKACKFLSETGGKLRGTCALGTVKEAMTVSMIVLEGMKSLNSWRRVNTQFTQPIISISLNLINITWKVYYFSFRIRPFNPALNCPFVRCLCPSPLSYFRFCQLINLMLTRNRIPLMASHWFQ